jgi:D-glycero-D-manno-heptose 1,7-bisphosphate phosphatase
MNGAAAVFLDRDGVINRNRDDYVKSHEEFEFLPGVLRALGALARRRWPVVVVSNQSAIGRGLVAASTVEAIHGWMMERVRRAGGRLAAVRYCPHAPAARCVCRKPRPGLLLAAADELNLDLARSYFVGDALSDLEAARAAGCTPVLVRTGRGERALSRLAGSGFEGVEVAEDLGAAVRWILAGTSA